MKELIEYRVRLVERLARAAREFTDACGSRAEFAHIEDSDWTTHQIAFHTRDVDKLVYGMRIQTTLREDHPKFDNFNADGWMAAHYNTDEPLENILAEFLQNVEGLCGQLRALPKEAWTRESRHATFGGGLTLQLWVERSLAHIEEHLKTLK